MTEDLLKLVFVVKFMFGPLREEERENNSVMHKEEFTGHLIFYVLDDNGY